MPASSGSKSAKSSGRLADPPWTRLSDDALLDVRLCDLNLSLEGTLVERCMQRLHEELAERDVLHRPHAWLSSEWFSPDGIPGIAAPFYLAHPRLQALERKMMLRVEGGSTKECMRIVRHEAGHAICSAYRLHRRRSWREAFGLASEPYPEDYRPDPFSRDFVLHLDWWYAQAHPLEDFAETFAVWLRSRRSRWRQRYQGWGALRKLETVDALMASIAGEKPPVRSRAHIEPLKSLRFTLREHYARRRTKYADDWPDFFDRDLRRIFSEEAGGHSSAATFLRKVRREVREAVADWTGGHPYAVDQVLRDMIDRCKELGLRLHRPSEEARMQVMLMVAVQTTHHMHEGANWISL